MKLFSLTIVFALFAYVAADVSHLFNRGNVTPYKGPLPGELPQNQPGYGSRQIYQQQPRYSSGGNIGGYQTGQYYPKYQQQSASRYQGYSG